MRVELKVDKTVLKDAIEKIEKNFHRITKVYKICPYAYERDFRIEFETTRSVSTILDILEEEGLLDYLVAIEGENDA